MIVLRQHRSVVCHHRAFSSLLSTSTIPVHQQVDAIPTYNTVFLHGLLGNKRNWRTPSVELAKLIPGMSCMSIDLRAHGHSEVNDPKLNSVENCAHDLINTFDHHDIYGSPRILSGHSFGGKVALKYVELCLEQGRELPRHTWIIDSYPGVHVNDTKVSLNQSVRGVLQSLLQVPKTFKSRDWMVKQLIDVHRIDKPTALWLATSIVANKQEGDEPTFPFRWSFDIDAVAELYHDFCGLDMWPLLESFPSRGLPDDTSNRNATIHIVTAGKNNVWEGGVTERLQKLCEPSMTNPSLFNVQHHPMPNVGHWIHSESLDDLLDLYVTAHNNSIDRG